MIAILFLLLSAPAAELSLPSVCVTEALHQEVIVVEAQAGRITSSERKEETRQEDVGFQTACLSVSMGVDFVLIGEVGAASTCAGVGLAAALGRQQPILRARDPPA